MLGLVRFDAAVCNMAFMDMACIEPLLGVLPALLAPAARFVFSVILPEAGFVLDRLDVLQFSTGCEYR
jgi:hypothetical protein